MTSSRLEDLQIIDEAIHDIYLQNEAMNHKEFKAAVKALQEVKER